MLRGNTRLMKGAYVSISGSDPDQNQSERPAANTNRPAGPDTEATEQVGHPSSPAAGLPDYSEVPPKASGDDEPQVTPSTDTAEQPPSSPPPPPAAPPPAEPPSITPPGDTVEQPPITPPPPAPPPAGPVPPALSEPYGEGQGPGTSEQPEVPDRGGWQPRPRNGFGITALILGILSILLFPGLGVILGLIGIIFGVLGILRGLRGEASNTGMSITGVVLSAVGLALGGLVAGFAAAVLPSINDCFDKDNYPTAHERNDCVKNNLPGWVPVND